MYEQPPPYPGIGPNQNLPFNPNYSNLPPYPLNTGSQSQTYNQTINSSLQTPSYNQTNELSSKSKID